MPDVLIRSLSRRTVDLLKDNASRRQVSLQQEMKRILEAAAETSLPDAETVAKRIRANLAKKRIRFSDSGVLQRADRSR